MNYKEWKDNENFIIKQWGEEVGGKVFMTCLNNRLNMSMKDFLSNCYCCGGDWGAMLLTGIKALAPDVWDAIPDDMGINPFATLCCVLYAMNVLDKEN